MDIHPQVQKLLQLPQYKQLSTEWFNQRKGVLTASDVPTVLGNNPYKSPYKLLLDKCGVGTPFTGNEYTRWGQKYEDEAIERYEKRHNKKNHNFGLIIHPTKTWLGGSPDGVTSDGILLEVKCPYKRKIITGEVPHHYTAQVLMNLEVCDLELAHFIEYRPNLYSPEDFELNVVEIKRDREWFNRSSPILKNFWNDVMLYKEIGIDKNPTYNAEMLRRNSRNDNRNNGMILDFIDSVNPKKEKRIYNFID